MKLIYILSLWPAAVFAASFPSLPELQVMASSGIFVTANDGIVLHSDQPHLHAQLIDLRLSINQTRPSHGFVSETIFGTMVHLERFSVLGAMHPPREVTTNIFYANGVSTSDKLVDTYRLYDFGHETNMTGFRFEWSETAGRMEKRELIEQLVRYVRDSSLPSLALAAWRESIAKLYVEIT